MPGDCPSLCRVDRNYDYDHDTYRKPLHAASIAMQITCRGYPTAASGTNARHSNDACDRTCGTSGKPCLRVRTVGDVIFVMRKCQRGCQLPRSKRETGKWPHSFGQSSEILKCPRVFRLFDCPDLCSHLSFHGIRGRQPVCHAARQPCRPVSRRTQYGSSTHYQTTYSSDESKACCRHSRPAISRDDCRGSAVFAFARDKARAHRCEPPRGGSVLEPDDIRGKLVDFDVLCVMRERMSWPHSRHRRSGRRGSPCCTLRHGVRHCLRRPKIQPQVGIAPTAVASEA